MNLNFFLTMKHWQLFLLLMGVPIFIEIAAVAILAEDPDGLDMLLQALPYFIVLVAGLFFGWFHTLGTALHAKLPESVKMNLTLFRVMLAIPVALVLSVAVVSWLVFTDHTEVFRGMDEAFVSAFLLLYFAALFALFYLLYFLSKCLVSVEEKAPVTFKHYVGIFFALWAFPVGVWFFQPRINAVFGDNSEAALHYDNIIDTF